MHYIICNAGEILHFGVLSQKPVLDLQVTPNRHKNPAHREIAMSELIF